MKKTIKGPALHMIMLKDKKLCLKTTALMLPSLSPVCFEVGDVLPEIHMTFFLEPAGPGDSVQRSTQKNHFPKHP